MPDICPTVTAETKEEFERQLDIIKVFANRIHIDLADDTLAPRKLLGIENMSWPTSVRVDLHIMCQNPWRVLSLIKANYKPELVIVHAEADGDFVRIANKLHNYGIKVGVALLQPTSVNVIRPALELIDHVLIFSGNLGYQGGSIADLSLLEKVRLLKIWKPNIEIGWDGGINDSNIASIANGGVNVLNVGGYIQSSTEPQSAYAKLQTMIG